MATQNAFETPGRRIPPPPQNDPDNIPSQQNSTQDSSGAQQQNPDDQNIQIQQILAQSSFTNFSDNVSRQDLLNMNREIQ